MSQITVLTICKRQLACLIATAGRQFAALQQRPSSRLQQNCLITPAAVVASAAAASLSAVFVQFESVLFEALPTMR